MKARFRGALLGLACGDAVGTTVEFRQRGSFEPVTDMVGGGPFQLNPGEWTDDTSMALCLATSLIERAVFDPRDQMERYVRWMLEGYLSSNGRCFDVGITVSRALDHFTQTREPFSGPTAPDTAGNGCLMRLAPVPMAFFHDRDQAIALSGESSRTTHGTQECLDASRLFGAMLHSALSGASRDDILFGQDIEGIITAPIRRIAEGAWRDKDEDAVHGSGYVAESLEAALWCFHRTLNFRDAVLLATNLGRDADTTAAICGQLAGAHYGEEGIPEPWRKRLVMADQIRTLADRLHDMGTSAPAQAARSSLDEAHRLADSGELRIRWHARFEKAPPLIPPDVDLVDRVDGMMLGLAVGDALGNTTESMIPSRRASTHGWIDGYLPNRHAGDRQVGVPSDDTQLAYWTLEQLLADGRLDPVRLGEHFNRDRIYGIGRSVQEFLGNFEREKLWYRAGSESAGNGALMRIAPVILPHLGCPTPELWGDALLAAHLTHRDSASTASCLAMVDLLWRLLCQRESPLPDWWARTFAETLEDIEGHQEYAPRAGRLRGFRGKLSQMIREHVIPALAEDLPVTEASDRWYSGAYLLETVPMVIHILGRYGHDPEEAILQAVNGTKDNDTIAAIVGAAVGALHGRSALRPDWLEGLLGRTRADDNGRVFELLKRAREKFVYAE